MGVSKGESEAGDQGSLVTHGDGRLCSIQREGRREDGLDAGWVQVGCQSTRRDRVVGLVLFV